MSDEDEYPCIVVCRDIPGEHTGGPGCWCCPTTVEIRPDTTDEQVRAAIEAAQRPQ